MPTLNIYTYHLKNYLSYPSIWLQHPTHAASLPTHPPLLFYHSVHTGYIFVVTGQYARVTYSLLYSSMHV